MHGQYRLGARPDLAGHLGRVDVHRLAVDVGKDDRATVLQDDIACGHKTHGRRDDLVAGLQVEAAHSDEQARGATGDADAGLAALERREPLLKQLRARAGREPARPQRGHDLGDFFVGDQRAVIWDVPGGDVELRIEN